VPGRAGGYPTGPPTVPDVRHSRIRFVSIRTVVTVRITSKLITPAGTELGCPSPVAGNLLRRLVGSKSFPSLLPVPRSARLCLPSGGSLGSPLPHVPRYCAPLRLPSAPLGSLRLRSLPNPLSASSVCVPYGSFMGGSSPSTPGLLIDRYPSSSGSTNKETGGSPTCPSFPSDDLLRSPQTPVVSCRAHPDARRAAAFPSRQRVGVLPGFNGDYPLYPFRSSITQPGISLPPAPYSSCEVCTRRSLLPCWLGVGEVGLEFENSHPLGNNDLFHGLSLHSLGLGLRLARGAEG
jgi:hypothetical protein